MRAFGESVHPFWLARKTVRNQDTLAEVCGNARDERPVGGCLDISAGIM